MAIDRGIILDETVPAGQPWSGIVARGQILRLTDLEGQQAVDFLCYNAADPAERYSATDTLKIARNIYVTTGRILYSDRAQPLFRVIDDSCGGHDTIAGCCSEGNNIARYGKSGFANCRDNFLSELAKHGLGSRDIVANLNFFMSVPVQPDGTALIVDGRSRPGDHIDLLAEMDVLAVLSNCPQLHNPASGSGPTPIQVTIFASA